ncbi:hypothetical protein HMPREF9997_00713 [Corynebacterium durum F0235]|uniref:Uncharacterized protein n=1 Tax=Corynebacterium durum F0235 TaxID=1035195 RepID=L1ML00_9CORY|nr:hypothetical protein HMPREF9997_00713 [Corynebacterium durum F0235]
MCRISGPDTRGLHTITLHSSMKRRTIVEGSRSTLGNAQRTDQHTQPEHLTIASIPVQTQVTHGQAPAYRRPPNSLSAAATWPATNRGSGCR